MNKPKRALPQDKLDHYCYMFGVKIEPRRGKGSLVHIYVEDDEIYYYTGNSFDIAWLDDLIQTLMSVKRGESV